MILGDHLIQSLFQHQRKNALLNLKEKTRMTISLEEEHPKMIEASLRVTTMMMVLGHSMGNRQMHMKTITKEIVKMRMLEDNQSQMMMTLELSYWDKRGGRMKTKIFLKTMVVGLLNVKMMITLPK